MRSAAALLLAAITAGCALPDLSEVRRGETFRYPVPLQAPAGAAPIKEIWVSYAMPSYVVFHATASSVGPASLSAGKSWEAVGEFQLSTSAPLGCQTLAYAISTSDTGLFPDPNLEPPAPIGLFVFPEKVGFWQELTSYLKETFCSHQDFKVGPDWRWSTPGPAPRTKARHRAP